MNLNKLSQPWMREREKSDRLNIRANSRFLWMHHPKNWELVTFKQKTVYKEGKSKDVTKHLFLPIFTPLRCVAGVNEVRSNGSFHDDSVAKAKYQNEGLTILDPEKFDYLVTYPAKNGTYYTDRFEILESVGSAIVKDYDREGFNQFRIDLMKNQVLNIPHKHFIRMLLIDNRRSIDKYIKDQHIPEHAVRLKKHQEFDKNVKTALKELEKKGYLVYE